MLVMKFGGTSVQDAAAILQTCEIVAGRLHRNPVVVVSALARVTDSLLAIAQAAQRQLIDEALRLINELRARHLYTAQGLTFLMKKRARPDFPLAAIEQCINEHCDQLERRARSIAVLGQLTPRSQDAIVACGEQLSSLIVSAALGAHGIPVQLTDARSFIITDNGFTNARPDTQESDARTRAQLLPIIAAGVVPVTQGFIGATPEGVTTTIGRGGSDTSAALIAAALCAEAIEIWTDVDGLMTADPRVVETARTVRSISFEKMARLSLFGAKVLHPASVAPAVKKDIPIYIFNTRNPGGAGTRIVKDPASRRDFDSIAFKRGITILKVVSTRNLSTCHFLQSAFEILGRHGISIDVVTASAESLSVMLDCQDCVEKIRLELESIGKVFIETSKAIVCIVGDGIEKSVQEAVQLWRAVAKSNINVISQEKAGLTLTFTVDEAEINDVVRSLHDELFLNYFNHAGGTA